MNYSNHCVSHPEATETGWKLGCACGFHTTGGSEYAVMRALAGHLVDALAAAAPPGVSGEAAQAASDQVQSGAPDGVTKALRWLGRLAEGKGGGLHPAEARALLADRGELLRRAEQAEAQAEAQRLANATLVIPLREAEAERDQAVEAGLRHHKATLRYLGELAAARLRETRLREALEWALDVLEISLKRIDSIDTFTAEHYAIREAGLAKARAVLADVLPPALSESEGVDERSSPESSTDAPGAGIRPALASSGSLSADVPPPECQPREFSSRMCEKGTKGCDVRHADVPPPEPAAPGEAT